jgi:hypothetical protein
VNITIFRDLSGARLRVLDLDFERLADHIGRARTYATKTACRLLKLATFGDRRSNKGSLRHDGNVLEVHGIEGDYDGGEVSLADAQMLLFERSVAAILYTSPSHTADRPRWRVLCPLSRPYPPAERARFVARLNGALGGVLAPESFEPLSQAFFVGRVNGALYETARVRGQPIDLLDDLDAAAVYPPKRGDAARAERQEKTRSADPVLRRLAERGLILRERADRGVDIVCLFEHDHTTPRAPGDCAYWPAHTGGFAAAHFKCLHSHCATRTDADFLSALGLQEPKHAADKREHLATQTMSNVNPEPLEWLEPRAGSRMYARGKVTLIGGDPGLGKSAMLTGDEAALTRAGHGVVVFSAEDDAHDTLRPRYDVAGADAAKVLHVEGVNRPKPDGGTERRSFNLERDVDALRDLLQRHPEVAFVRIDPVSAYLGRVDSHRNAEVRGLLAQLEDVAREFHVAIVVVTHLNKSTAGPTLYRFVGSLAFVAACRLAFVVARDPENADRRLVVPAKVNLTGEQIGYAFTIEGAWHEGVGQHIARVAWELEPVSVTLDGLVQSDSAHRRHERERVKEFLKRELAAGAVQSKTLFEKAAAEGISQRTLFRAKDELSIPARRQFGAWYWASPAQWSGEQGA